MDVPAHEALCKSTEGAVCTTQPRYGHRYAIFGDRGQNEGRATKRATLPIQREPQRGEATSIASRSIGNAGATQPTGEVQPTIPFTDEPTAQRLGTLWHGKQACDRILTLRVREGRLAVVDFCDTNGGVRERGLSTTVGVGRTDRGGRPR